MATKTTIKSGEQTAVLGKYNHAKLSSNQPQQSRLKQNRCDWPKHVRQFQTKNVLLPFGGGSLSVRRPVTCSVETVGEAAPTVTYRVEHDGRLYEAASIKELREKISRGIDQAAGRKWYSFIALPSSVSDLSELKTENDLRLVLIDRQTVKAARASAETMHRDSRWRDTPEKGRARSFDVQPSRLGHCGCSESGFVPDTKAWRTWLLRIAAKHRATVEKLQAEWSSVVSAAAGDRAPQWFDPAK